jgi:hypothetical protein
MITWNLTEQEADYILRCLQARPWAEVAALITKLVEQSHAPRAADDPSDDDPAAA